MRTKIFPLCLTLLVLLSMPNALLALELRGNGTAYWKRVIKVYDAELYLPEGVASDAALNASTDRCLILTYARNLDKQKFIIAADMILERQLSETQLEAIAGPLSTLNEAYRDVEQGDRYTLCYHAASKNTSLKLNDELLVNLESSEFAYHYFGIWLSENQPLSNGLRRSLLGDN